MQYYYLIYRPYSDFSSCVSNALSIAKLVLLFFKVQDPVQDHTLYLVFCSAKSLSV